MSKTIKLKAETREDLGTSKAKRLRAKKLVPGIFYGKGAKNISLQFEEKSLKKALSTDAGLNVIMELTIKTAKGEQTESVIPQDVQFNALNDSLEHIDLRKINLKEKIVTKVPVRLVGDAPGVKTGGILVQHFNELELKCLPTDIPSHIDIDISGMADIGATIKVGEVKLPGNIEALHLHPEHVAVALMAPKKEEEPEVAPLEEGVEPEVIGKDKEEGEEGAEAAVEGKGEEKGKEKGQEKGKEKGKEAEAKKPAEKKAEKK
ncbi:50S ribosomal protein L25 [Candidatus Margulisiibacteriota bacterium]